MSMLGFAYIIVHILGCAQLQTKEFVFSPSHKKYTFAMPEKGWEQIKTDKEDIALWHKQHHAMIALISSNVENKGVPLETLNNRLFIGIKEKERILNENSMVDNQSAIHTILLGEIDNCKLKITSYVVKAGDSVYDLLYWAPPDSFDYAKGDFDKMINSFKFTFTEEPPRKKNTE